MSSVSPQNPYDSYLVEASAGSGKTYQLSRRFLYLVGAGAHPSSILTITFTVKAAKEMRARILQDATQLLISPKIQNEFDASIMEFYRNFTSIEKTKGNQNAIKPPRNAIQTAKEILSSTQLLKIATIDSIFNQWVGKFPIEASGKNTAETIPSPFTLMDSLDEKQYDENAWVKLFQEIANNNDLNSLDIYHHFEADHKGPLSIKTKLEELHKQNTYLWQAHETGQTQIHLHKAPSEYDNFSANSEEELIKQIEPEIRKCCQLITNSDSILKALPKGKIDALRIAKFLTKDFKVSGQKLRGEKRNSVSNEILSIELELKKFINEKRIKKINASGLALFDLYSKWSQIREKEKQSNHIIEFSDLAKGVFRIFNSESCTGPVWLIQRSIQHLMIDEFQDTSILQWEIFKKLSTELLAGIDSNDVIGLPASLFIVGDKKQSIYGFREGDPIVLKLARNFLQLFDKQAISMSQSFRSSPLILEYVNKVFADGIIESFPQHSTASLDQLTPFIPDCAKITISTLFENENSDEDDDKLSDGIKKEAFYIAKSLKKALNNAEEYPVYDKSTKRFRPLQASDCCILYRSGTYIDAFEQALRKEGLPCIREEKRGYFTRREIQDILSLLSFLSKPADALSLVTFLKSPLAGLLDKEVIDILYQAKKESMPQQPLKNLSSAILEQLECSHKEVYITLVTLYEYAKANSPYQILIFSYQLLQATSRYEKYLPQAEATLAKNNLFKLLEICITLEENGYTTLNSCLGRLTKMTLLDEQANAKADMNAITLMTIHKSKGLEYPFTCLVNTANEWFKLDRYWVKNINSPEGGIAYTSSKANQPVDDSHFDAIIELQKRQLQEESFRLLYVALTRASHYLMISAHQPAKKTTEGASPYQRLKMALESFSFHKTEEHQHGKDYTIDFRNGYTCSILEKNLDNCPQNTWQPTVPATEIPAEIEIIQPHKQSLLDEHSKSERVNLRPQYQYMASHLGTFIHKILELETRNLISSPELQNTNINSWEQNLSSSLDSTYRNIWQAEVMQAWKHLNLASSEWDDLYLQTYNEIIATLNSPSWKRLFENVHKIFPELNIVYFHQQQLVRGTIDLLVEKENNEILIIDYKTTPFKPTKKIYQSITYNRNEDLINFCIEHGYDKQLKIYADACRQIYQDTQIKTAVYLTKENEIIYLD
ncbi:MAG: UvrD-helicase domain-containing protein [Bdellovibrionota bacterium]